MKIRKFDLKKKKPESREMIFEEKTKNTKKCKAKQFKIG